MGFGMFWGVQMLLYGLWGFMGSYIDFGVEGSFAGSMIRVR